MKKPRFREKNNRIENQIALGNAIRKRIFSCKKYCRNKDFVSDEILFYNHIHLLGEILIRNLYNRCIIFKISSKFNDSFIA